jgi:uncharacterized membrane protein
MITITEIHPMLVHFPIVFWISAEAIAVIILGRGGDVSARTHGSLTAFYALLAGTLFGVLAAFFGDIALDHAVAAGFPIGPLETHEAFAITTLSIFGLHTILRLLAIWRRFSLTGIRGWLAEVPGLAGIVLLIITAYLGGELVYHYGVNVAAAIAH